MRLKDLNTEKDTSDVKTKMPVLFMGHGSPMNAIEENEFVKGWKDSIKTLAKPEAILCISAHWETAGTFVTAMEKPLTIHDFGGFPRELYEVQYPAPGSPELAVEIKDIIKNSRVALNLNWGLDHGTWSVLKHMYPKADIPVIQLSLDYSKEPRHHYELAKELSFMRNKGVLIIGSGNMVHNLGTIDWNKLNTGDYAYDWAREALEEMKKFILNDDHESLIGYKSLGRAFQLSVPTPEHFLPLLYVLALKEKDEKTVFFNDKTIAGSIAMTCVKIDKT